MAPPAGRNPCWGKNGSMLKRADARPLFFGASWGVSRSGARYLFLSPTAHFSQQLEKWAKEPEETKGFFTSLRAMGRGNLILRSTRSRKSSRVVPSKDCLSNSAAAADTHAEQRFWFYRCNSERQRRRREVSSSYGTTTAMYRERVVQGIRLRKV